MGNKQSGGAGKGFKSTLKSYGSGETDVEGVNNEKRRSLTPSQKKEQDQELYFTVRGYVDEEGKFVNGGTGDSEATAKTMILDGARPFWRDQLGNNVMHEAAARGLNETVKLILKLYPECLEIEGQYDNTALTMAMMKDQRDTIKLLIDQRAANPFFHLVKGHINEDLFNFTLNYYEEVYGEDGLKDMVKNCDKLIRDEDREEAVPANCKQRVAELCGYV